MSVVTRLMGVTYKYIMHCGDVNGCVLCVVGATVGGDEPIHGPRSTGRCYQF